MQRAGKIIIYQLPINLFGNNHRQNLPFAAGQEKGCEKFNNITDVVLAYFKQLGITHLWYTGNLANTPTTGDSSVGRPAPPGTSIKGAASSHFDTRDCYDVKSLVSENPDQRMLEFESMVERTHQAGLKVIIDFMPNRVARQCKSLAKPPEVSGLGQPDDCTHPLCPGNNLFYLNKEEILSLSAVEWRDAGQRDIISHEPSNESPERAGDNYGCSSLRYDNQWNDAIQPNYEVDYSSNTSYFDPIPDTWQRLREILLFWAGKGIDGFNCEGAHLMPLEFWNWVIPVVKRSYPSLLFITDNLDYTHVSNWLDYGQFDFLLDKAGLFDILRKVITGILPASEISLSWQNPSGRDDLMIRLLPTHDSAGLESGRFPRVTWKDLPAMVVASTLNNGPVMCYFGQEIGINVGGFAVGSSQHETTSQVDYAELPSLQLLVNHDAFNDANLTRQQKDLQKFYERLFTLCHDKEPLHRGALYDLMWVNQHSLDPRYLYAYLRYAANECLLIVLNFGRTNFEDLRIHIPQHAFDLMQDYPDSTLKVERHSRLKAEELLWGKDIVSFTVSEAIDTGIPLSIKPLTALIYSF